MKRGGPLKPRSKKGASNEGKFHRLKKRYLGKHPHCDMCLGPSVDIHHSLGRGAYLLDEATFVALCRPCHHKVHNNPAWAKQQGLIGEKPYKRSQEEF